MSIEIIKILRKKFGAGFLDCKKAVEATNNIDEAIEWLKKNGVAKALKKNDRIAAEGISNILIKGDKGLIFEVNSETDFVSKNQEFLKLVNEIGELLIKNNPSSISDALELTINNETIEEKLIQATSKIGEKISLRRFYIHKIDNNQFFGPYIHQGGKIATLSIIEGGDTDIARGISMHATALDPTYISQDQVDKSFVETRLNHFKKEALEDGKPKQIVDKIAQGKLKKELASICLLNQEFVKGDGETVEEYLKNKNTKLINIYRYAVGEGVEKNNLDFVDEVNSQMKKAGK